MDLISSINQSISLVSRLREISKNITEAEFKNLLADLSNELADAKVQMAELKYKIATQADEIQTLKRGQPAAKEVPRIKWGCYEFEGQEGLFCTACYDTKGQKSLTSRFSSRFRMCPVCNATIGT